MANAVGARQAILPVRWFVRLRSSLTDFGWYPLMLAMASYLQLYVVGRTGPAPAVRSFALVCVIAIALTACTIHLFGRERGSAVAAIVVAALLSANAGLRVVPFLLAIGLLIIEHAWARRGRIRLPWGRIHEALTLVVCILLLFQLWQLVSITQPEPMAAPDAWAGQPLNSDKRHDIYLILADAHGREDVLADGYAYEDRPFLDVLRGIGFEVAPSSRANYDLTRFSVASLLTASPLDSLGDILVKDQQDDFARRTIEDNPAFPLLKRAGFDVTVLSGGYEHLGLRSADAFIDEGQLNELEMALLRNSTAGSMVNVIAPDFRFLNIRDRVHAELHSMLEIAGSFSIRPQFVFVHLPVPHYPFVFNATCGPSQASTDPAAWQDGGPGGPATDAALVAQTICIDRLLGESVADLVRRDPDAAVIVFSDHGPDQHLDWANPDEAGIWERTSNLFAWRTPGHPGLFPDDVTLVNVLPTLFNAYLGTTLPLHPDQVWFGPRPQDNRFVLEGGGAIEGGATGSGQPAAAP